MRSHFHTLLLPSLQTICIILGEHVIAFELVIFQVGKTLSFGLLFVLYGLTLQLISFLKMERLINGQIVIVLFLR